jgi:hypothetical protein
LDGQADNDAAFIDMTGKKPVNGIRTFRSDDPARL